MCEGSYPYVTGGVSSWIQMLVTSLKDIEFCVTSIVVDRAHGGLFKYKMPSNLTSIHECYLQDADYTKMTQKKLTLSDKEKNAFYSFIMGENIDWSTIFNFFLTRDVSVNSLLLGNDLLDIIKEFYEKYYPRLPYTDFLWTYRSMMLPLCTLLKYKLPKADIYHSASTGYSGIQTCLAKYAYNKPVIITEHGIYTREREEDIIRSSFVAGSYKDIWIRHFYKLSDCAYRNGDKIISLFENSRGLQVEMGCNPAKTMVIPNGVDPHRFDSIAQKDPSDTNINLGIIARVAPIKDIKTLINAYAAAKDKVRNLVLYIMGGHEEDEVAYYNECVDLAKNLGLSDVIFTGNINLNEYMGRMDIIILTSISEGQPISILEAMSAKKPCIATRVGNCEEMILGSDPETDKPAGIITPIMSVEQISAAIVDLAEDAVKRRDFGEVGKKRVEEKYPYDMVIERYRNLYNSLT